MLKQWPLNSIKVLCAVCFAHTKTPGYLSFARFVILPRISVGRCISMRMNFQCFIWKCWIRSRGQMLNKLKANRMLKAHTLPSCWYFCSDKSVLLAENTSATAPLWHVSIGKLLYFHAIPTQVVWPIFRKFKSTVQWPAGIFNKCIFRSNHKRILFTKWPLTMVHLLLSLIFCSIWNISLSFTSVACHWFVYTNREMETLSY